MPMRRRSERAATKRGATSGSRQHVDELLQSLFGAIAEGDGDRVAQLVNASPELASAPASDGATRRQSQRYFLARIGHYVYAGDTALHIAAAAYNVDVARMLVARGARLGARNRRGAEPLHYAADSNPDSARWRPGEQARTIAYLIDAGADPNSTNRDGATPLHRAVRTRSSAAVRALIEGGADFSRRNKNGSTPVELASRTSGRGGSGSPAARAEQAEILALFAGRLR
jgi:ankyrin repeat protein